MRQGIVLALVTVVAVVAGSAAETQKRDFTESHEKRLNRLQPPVLVMDTIELGPGMTIGDIGAGKGRYAVWFADRVGPEGKVYANDIDEDALDYTAERCKRLGFENVETVLGEVENPKLPANTLDIAFMVSTYHHLDKPLALVRNIVPSLKPGGRLVIVERDPEKSPLSKFHATSRDDLVGLVERAGFRMEKIETFLEEDNIYFFTLPDPEGGE